MWEIKKDKVSVDTPNCISCGACVAICSEVFEFDKTSKSIVKKQPETDEEVVCAKQAAAACPVAIIDVKEVKAVNDPDYKGSNDNKKIA